MLSCAKVKEASTPHQKARRPRFSGGKSFQEVWSFVLALDFGFSTSLAVLHARFIGLRLARGFLAGAIG